MTRSPDLAPPSAGSGGVPAGMRAVVAESWYRSAAAGLDAEARLAPITLGGDLLADYRAAHPLAQVFPLLDDVLGRAARDCDAVMAVADAAGQLLWVCGESGVLRRAETIGFVEGSNWDERLAGTNAPGMALRLGEPVMVRGAEHFREAVRPWSCAASPIHDPATGALLGVLDVTGGDEIVVPQTMAMVRAAARMAESELMRIALVPDRAPAVTDARGLTVALQALGRDELLLTVHDGRGPASTVRCSRRHSELLVLLASAPGGLAGDELATLLYEEDAGRSTLRVEMNRLRALLGEDLLGSRPYRLTAGISADWLEVEALLAAGDLRRAVQAFRGPLLPRSTAPGVRAVADRVQESLRHAVLASRDADVMSGWTRSAWGADDYEMWTAQRAVLAVGSPMRPLVDGQLARLDRDLGL